jgi:hypothetical protein
MSNHHLRNANLSLKAKGLLSMMLSLPEDWNYTTRGLAKICKEGVDAIGAALRELEAAGYIVRHKLRDRQGRISDTEYVIYEQPQLRKPDTDSPDTENPYMDKPDTEKPAELNIVEASNPVPTPLLGHRCRSSQEITGSPTPFSTSNHYLWICESASFSLSNPNIAA